MRMRSWPFLIDDQTTDSENRYVVGWLRAGSMRIPGVLNYRSAFASPKRRDDIAILATLCGSKRTGGLEVYQTAEYRAEGRGRRADLRKSSDPRLVGIERGNRYAWYNTQC
ncbi:hypothetical protein U1Q18_048061 [Sarracenia purpurea var. burkii]